MDAIESGRYDIHKIALILPQTGGGCRASNYIHLLRKALEKNGYGFIPVISLNFSGLESNPGFKLTKTDARAGGVCTSDRRSDYDGRQPVPSVRDRARLDRQGD